MKARFFAEFLLVAFIMKIAGELVHEVFGHGLFVLLFGGRIIQVYLSILWPYELSYIRWSGNFENWQIIWIEGGGILTCTVVSIILQILLLLNVSKNREILTPIFWLAFWTFLNPAGYLLLGGISPFGDVAALISRGALTRTLSIILGLGIFLGSFISISRSLCNILCKAYMLRESNTLRLLLSLFWLIIPCITFAYYLRAEQPSQHAEIAGILSLLPAAVSFITARFICLMPHKKGEITDKK